MKKAFENLEEQPNPLSQNGNHATSLVTIKRELKMIHKKFLATVSLFEGLPSEQLESLGRIALARSFVKGAVIFREGEAAQGFYILTEGVVKVYKLSPEGREQILHVFSRGEPFGEVPVFAGGNYPAYAEAMETAKVLYIPRADFLSLIQKNPSITLNMLAVLSRRLRSFSSLIEDLSLKEVPVRLAAYLIYSPQAKERLSVELPFSKNQLASLLGTIPETLSRILAKMTREGYIELLSGRRLVIRNYQALEEIARGEKRLT